MLHNKLLFNLISLGLLLIAIEPIMAQSILNSQTSLDNSITQVSFKPPPDDGKPDDTSGAGSRQGQCPQDTNSALSSDKPSIVALVPKTNYGLTLAERPTFWIYLPKTSAKQVVLSIREQDGQHHSQTHFSITGTPGIISIKPSDDSPTLKVDKNYQWAAVLVCGTRPGPNDPAIASWVRRVALPESISDPSERKTGLEQAVWYGERGIWYDTLTALEQARQAQPENQDLSNIWANLLKSVGLETIPTESLRF